MHYFKQYIRFPIKSGDIKNPDHHLEEEEEEEEEEEDYLWTTS